MYDWPIYILVYCISFLRFTIIEIHKIYDIKRINGIHVK